MYVEAVDGEYLPLHQSDITMEDGEDTDEHWTPNTIVNLLESYLEHSDKFRNSKMRKKGVWNEISKIIGRPPASCDKKFRNLKQTYIRHLKKKEQGALKSVRWPYFGLFEAIYSTNGEYHPDIQKSLQEKTEADAKPSTSVRLPSRRIQEAYEDGESSTAPVQNDDTRKRMNRKRFTEFKKMAVEMRDRQRTVEAKIDKLINIVEESNSIQRDRNRLFQQYLEKLHQNDHRA